MTEKNNLLKVVFGLIIFLFSLALAYFTAVYTEENTTVDFFGTLLMYTGVYLIIGVAISKIYPISLGFLFSADILLLHVMFENFGDLSDMIKAGVIGGIIIALYVVAWLMLPDINEMSGGSKPKPSAPTPPASNVGQ